METRLDGACPGADTFRDLVDREVQVEAQDDDVEAFGTEGPERGGHRLAPTESLGRVGGDAEPRPLCRKRRVVQTERPVPASSLPIATGDRKSTRLNSSHANISY